MPVVQESEHALEVAIPVDFHFPGTILKAFFLYSFVLLAVAFSVESLLSQSPNPSTPPQIGNPYSQLDSDAARARDESFHVPTEIRGAQKCTSVRLQAVEAENDLNGLQLRHQSYNRCLVGPTIRVKPGTQLKIHLQNDLPTEPQPGPAHADNQPYGLNTTNLHTHGLHVSPQSPADDIFKEIEPTKSFDFVFDIHPKHPAGTFWYHPHKHGSTAFQLASGMSGALIVEGGLDDIPEIKAAHEKVMVLQQFVFDEVTPTSGRVTQDAVYKGTGNLVQAINGVVTPTIVMRPGEIQRWRIIHAGTADAITLDLEGILFQEIAVDGLATGRMDEKKALILYPGYRTDVLVQAPNIEGIKLLYTAIRDPRKSIRNQIMERSNLLRLVIEGAPLAMRFPSTDQLTKVAAFQPEDVSVQGDIQTSSSQWSAVDRSGKRLTSESYRGKFVLLVLHRGIECIHCAEQLSRLRREHELLQKIGVNVVAISPKLPEGEQVDQFLSELPFPVLTDTSKETFRTFNCLDLSGETIHGLFLLDPQSNCLFANRSDTAIEDPTQWIFEKLQFEPQGEKK